MQQLLVFLSLFSISSFAGNRVGNGGDIVFCESKRSYEILDFYEARKNDVQLQKSKKNDPYDIVKERIAPLKTLAPKLHTQYMRRLKTLPGDIEFREQIELTDVKDSLHAFIGKGCEVQQAAIRLGYPRYNKGKQYVFNKELWDKLNSDQKAGLLLHELFYEHVSKLGTNDSRPVRQFVSFMFSDQVKGTSRSGFWAKVNEWGLPIYPQ